MEHTNRPRYARPATPPWADRPHEEVIDGVKATFTVQTMADAMKAMGDGDAHGGQGDPPHLAEPQGCQERQDPDRGEATVQGAGARQEGSDPKEFDGDATVTSERTSR